MSGGVAWIAVDWGSSHLRAWLMDAGDRVIERRASDRGVARIARHEYEPALLDLVGGALPATGTVPVICCGMAGSRQGWGEAAYRAVPCEPPTAADAVRVPTADRRLDVAILPGLKQPSPADVMRGEETQIKGVLAETPGFDGVICLPGTHTKWAQVSAGEVVSFRTFMTGEIFALLTEASVLRHTAGGTGWDATAFGDAVAEGLSNPSAIAARLFALRAEALLHDLPPAAARSRLSGYLIGMELAAARPYWLGQPVTVVGAEAPANAYAAALAAQGATPALREAERTTLAGLAAARRHLRGRMP